MNRLVAIAAVMTALAAAPTPAAAQMRPLDGVNWDLLRGHGTVAVRAGGGVLWGQRASLAGLEGRLIEAGEIRAEWRTGRVVFEVGGTTLRILDRYSAYASPVTGTRSGSGQPLRDAGSWRVASAVRLTPADRDVVAGLRFGTRLPNADDAIGLERDQTDFFALAGAQLRRKGISLGAEFGLGIHGTHDPDAEQVDVLVYTAVLEGRHGAVAPRIGVAGHHAPPGLKLPRGNENRSELKIGLRAGRRWSLEADLVRGLSRSGPHAGVLLGGGLRH
jgi:hypothetical protein